MALFSISRVTLLPTMLLLAVGIAVSQQRPLITEDVDIIPPGAVRLEAGVDFLQNAKFPASGLTGDLSRIGVVGINIGLSPNVEFQIDGVAQNYLGINTATPNPPIPRNFGTDANSTSDVGDFTVSTKIKLRNETKHLPSLGFRLGVQLPNSDQARGLGTNQTNVFGTVLFGKKFGSVVNGTHRVNTFGNLGLGILPAPTKLFTQNDVLLYGFGGIVRLHPKVNLAGEVNGRASTRRGAAPFGTESQSEARLGVQLRAVGLRFDAAGIVGLTKVSPRTGITFGVTYDSPSFFTPAK